MPTNRNEVINQLAKRSVQTQETAAADKPKTVEDWIRSMAPAMKEALPRHMDIDRFTRITLTQLRTNPELRKCSVPSLLAAVMQCAQFGLEPGVLGHVYLVPYRNKKTGMSEVQFILGYRGMIELAYRSEKVKSIDARAVYEHDEFHFEYGKNEILSHKPKLADRGKPIAYYAYAKLDDGTMKFEVMSIDDIERIRKRSRASENGPWVTDYDEMAKKTVLRRLFKYLPISIEAQRALEQDETVKTEISPDMTEVVNLAEGDFQVKDEVESEVVVDTPAEEPKPKQEAKKTDAKPVDEGEGDEIVQELSKLF